MGSIPGPGRYPEEGNGSPLQYSCLGNPMDRRAWQITVQGVCKSQTQLNDFTIQGHGLTINLSSYLERWILSSCSLSTTPQTPSMPWSGILICVWCPSFYIQWPGFCSYFTRNHPQLPGSGGWRWGGLYVVPKVH